MYDRILVPVDGSEDATRALAQALVVCRLARNAASTAADAPAQGSGPTAAAASAALPSAKRSLGSNASSST